MMSAPIPPLFEGKNQDSVLTAAGEKSIIGRV